jgi:hypothetical protein
MARLIAFAYMPERRGAEVPSTRTVSPGWIVPPRTTVA